MLQEERRRAERRSAKRADQTLAQRPSALRTWRRRRSGASCPAAWGCRSSRPCWRARRRPSWPPRGAPRGRARPAMIVQEARTVSTGPSQRSIARARADHLELCLSRTGCRGRCRRRRRGLAAHEPVVQAAAAAAGPKRGGARRRRACCCPRRRPVFSAAPLSTPHPTPSPSMSDQDQGA